MSIPYRALLAVRAFSVSISWRAPYECKVPFLVEKKGLAVGRNQTTRIELTATGDTSPDKFGCARFIEIKQNRVCVWSVTFPVLPETARSDLCRAVPPSKLIIRCSSVCFDKARRSENLIHVGAVIDVILIKFQVSFEKNSDSSFRFKNQQTCTITADGKKNRSDSWCPLAALSLSTAAVVHENLTTSTG